MTCAGAFFDSYATLLIKVSKVFTYGAFSNIKSFCKSNDTQHLALLTYCTSVAKKMVVERSLPDR